MFLILQFALLGLAASASVPLTLVAQGDNGVLAMDKCWPLMESVGLNARFPGAVSHAIHSLTLEDLRHYFDPDTEENNGIPIINFDLNSKEMLLPNAPSNGLEQGFMTMSLRAADQVLSHMDNRDYDLANYTPLERLVHALHMQEVWEMMSKRYNELVQNPPKDKQVCDCVRNVNQNGVKKFLNYMALKIRYPEVMYGKSLEMSQDQPESFQFQDGGAEKDEEILPRSGANGHVGKGDYDLIGVYKFEFEKDKTNKLTEPQDPKSKSDNLDGKLNMPENEKNQRFEENARGKYEWDSNLYKFNLPKNQRKEESEPRERSSEGKYNWDANVYKFGFPKDQKTKAEAGKSKVQEKSDRGNYNWDGNIYKYHFQKNQIFYKPEETSTQQKYPAKGSYNWEANLYKYNFPKNLENAKEGKKSSPIQKTGEGNYNWEANLYKFNFPNEAKEAAADAQKSNGKVLEPWQIKDEGMVHLRNEASWKVWKQAMLDMDEADHYQAAYFIYCMLN